MKTLSCTYVITAVLALGVAGDALAAAQVFTGQNPAIFATANPGGNAALLASVDRPEDPSRVSSSLAGRLDPAQIVQQAVLGQISAQINDQIFNGGQASGSFNLGNGNLISYLRAGGVLSITVVDPIRGSTVIEIPDI